MAGISYLVLIERPGNNVHKFFSSHRAKNESPKTIKEADAWASKNLQEHGTTNVRVSISKVLWSISG